MQKGRDPEINIFGIPEGSPLGLKTKRRQCAVVSTTARDSRLEQVAMREQIGRHEGPVAVSTHRDTVAIGHTHINRFVNRRLGRRHDLFHKGIIHRFRITDHWHRCTIHDRVPLGQQGQVSDPTHSCKTMRTTRNLGSRFGITELPWVSPYEQG